MKKIVLKLTILSVLLAVGVFVQNDSHPVAAATSFACWQNVFNKWNQCDNEYFVTINNHAVASSTCSIQAQNTCPPADYNCLLNAWDNCMIANDITYNNRGNAYNSCMFPLGDAGNCTEQIQNDMCEIAMNRIADCAMNHCPNGVCDPTFGDCVAASGRDQFCY